MANKEQMDFAEKYFSANPEKKVLYLNPKGEWFTDKDYAQNSLGKDSKGKIEEIYKETVETKTKNKVKDV